MSSAYRDMTAEVHRRILGLPRFDASARGKDLPKNGIYFFFEAGETIVLDDRTADRIVRVGTHTGEDRLSKRIWLHYRGTCRRSVFRAHVAEAILRRENSAVPFDRRAASEEMESRVSEELASHFTFACVEVETKERRPRLESGLIALLARYPLAPPSPTWLGRFARADAIQSSGLWNTQHVASSPLSDVDAEELLALVTLNASMQTF
jgi:hypothetical protein